MTMIIMETINETNIVVFCDGNHCNARWERELAHGCNVDNEFAKMNRIIQRANWSTHRLPDVPDDHFCPGCR